MKNDTKPISDPVDKVVEFIEALKNHMKWTLGNEPGCRKINVVSDANDRNKFHLYKLYEDENALIKRAQSHPCRTPHSISRMVGSTRSVYGRFNSRL